MQIELDPHPERSAPPLPTVNPYAPPRAVVAAPYVDVAIWNPYATANWSLLFSPAFGAYLQALNWEALGEPDKARTSKMWFYVSLGVIAIRVALSIVNASPGGNPFLSAGIAFWYLIIWYFASGRAQGKYVKEDFGSDYPRRSWSTPLLIGLGCNVALFFITFAGGMAWVATQR